ncbi:MAG: hypothetical protein KatS3mg097_654 [Candidatus Parcubacteria bacterium]|nr:MAG: hypothetical protein KatS3mg097_654 [Candidatus Parcubacteria bacterium]
MIVNEPKKAEEVGLMQYYKDWEVEDIEKLYWVLYGENLEE